MGTLGGLPGRLLLNDVVKHSARVRPPGKFLANCSSSKQRRRQSNMGTVDVGRLHILHPDLLCCESCFQDAAETMVWQASEDSGAEPCHGTFLLCSPCLSSLK